MGANTTAHGNNMIDSRRERERMRGQKTPSNWVPINCQSKTTSHGWMSAFVSVFVFLFLFLSPLPFGRFFSFFFIARCLCVWMFVCRNIYLRSTESKKAEEAKTFTFFMYGTNINRTMDFLFIELSLSLTLSTFCKISPAKRKTKKREETLAPYRNKLINHSINANGLKKKMFQMIIFDPFKLPQNNRQMEQRNRIKM